MGVEQTVNGRFKNYFEKHGNTKSYRIPYGSEFVISFSPRGFARHSFNVVFENDKTVLISKSEDPLFHFVKLFPMLSELFLLLMNPASPSFLETNKA